MHAHVLESGGMDGGRGKGQRFPAITFELDIPLPPHQSTVRQCSLHYFYYAFCQSGSTQQFSFREGLVKNCSVLMRTTLCKYNRLKEELAERLMNNSLLECMTM